MKSPGEMEKTQKHRDCLCHPKSSRCTTNPGLQLPGGLRGSGPVGGLGRWKEPVPDLLVAQVHPLGCVDPAFI